VVNLQAVVRTVKSSGARTSPAPSAWRTGAGRFGLAVCLALGAGVALAAEQARAPITAESMWELKRLASPAVSPDGQHAVVAVTSNDRRKDTTQTQLWLFDTRSGESRPLTGSDTSSSNPVWSPDGSRILFQSRRGDDSVAQLYVIALAGGEAQRITSVPTGVGNAAWFPDGRQIAFVSRVWTDLDSWDDQDKRMKERRESKVSARAWDRAPIRYWSTWLDDREAHIFRVAAEGGDPVAITRGRGVKLMGEGSFDISPDGREIALTVDTDDTGVAGNADIFVLDVDGTGPARNITAANPASDMSPSYSPDGRWLAYSRQQERGFYGDRQRLVLRDRRDGSEKVITETFDRSVSSPRWVGDGRSAVVAVDDAGTVRLHRIEIPSGRITAITGSTSFGSPSVSRDGRTLVALNESFVQPPTLVRVDPRSGAATPLSRFNDALLARMDLGSYESVTYTGANGDPIQMWVNYPPGFDRSRKYPLFLLIHGGPHNGITDGFHWRWNAQVFSGWGYVTAWHNFHGSSGFGNAFTDSINPDQADLPYQDTIAAAEWFKAQPWIDGDRLAAGGGSYGGYLTSIVLGREHPFKALIAHAAVFNWFTQVAADYGASRGRFGEFWEHPERFQANSPHFGAGNFNTPTLVIHGEQDFRVPVNHGIELFNILQNRGVRSRLVYYPDENHWVLKQNNSIRWYEEVQKWLAEFIGKPS
jgi:dipeptidyl aminopeptidase/acylaminoacyl peptidase